jgi:monovalent cation:H+ antiporter-2, CPA2 family
MNAHEALPYLREALVFLACAGIAIPMLQRLRVSPVLGFLVLGNLFGPYGLGLLADSQPWLGHLVIGDLRGVRHLAELGVTLLLFVIGLELSFPRLLSLRRLVLGAGLVQVLASTVLIGGLAYVFGNSLDAATVLGLCLSLSSTAVVMQLLVERREHGTPLGRASFAILLLQDLAVVPLLVLLSVLGDPGSSFLQLAALALLKGVAAVAAILLLGRRLVRWLFQRVSALHQPGSFMALTLLVAVGTAAATAAAGLSMALGAFLAGLLIAETEYRHEVEVNIDPFKSLLLGVFFLSVGMAIDLRVLLADPFTIMASVAGLFLVKGAVIAAALRRFGFARAAAAEGALLLGGGGEFALIAVGAAMIQGILDREVGQFMLIVVSLSMLATPFAAALGRTLRRRSEAAVLRGADKDAAALPELEGHVVVAGFGRVGQLLGRVLDANRVPYLALETDLGTVERLRRLGLPLHVGDASRPELLARAGAGRAAAVVVTMNDANAARRAVQAMRRHFPQVPVLARTRDEEHAGLLRAAGATGVVPETLEAGLQLSGHVLEALGLPADSRADFLQRQRERELQGGRGQQGAGPGHDD